MTERDSRGRFIKDNKGYWTGKHRDKATQEKMKKTQFKKGQVPWNKSKKNPYSEKTLKAISETLKKNPVRYWEGKTFSENHKRNLSESHKGEKAGNWKGGISKEPYSFDFDKELKELIRFRDGYKCQGCGCPEIENTQKLTVHHIDYEKKNCKPSNLTSLCRKCNSKVNFNRSKWTKYFQKKIKKIMNSNAIQLNFRFGNLIKRKDKVDLTA